MVHSVSGLPSSIIKALGNEIRAWEDFAAPKSNTQVKHVKHWWDSLHKTKLKSSDYCMHERLTSGGNGTKWTVAYEQKFACQRCTNASLPCCFWDVGLMKVVLLPLHPLARQSEKMDEEGYWIRSQGSFTRQVSGAEKVFQEGKMKGVSSQADKLTNASFDDLKGGRLSYSGKHDADAMAEWRGENEMTDSLGERRDE